MAAGFLPAHGGYQKLRSYRKAQIVYDATVYFCDRFIDRRSRTHDHKEALFVRKLGGTSGASKGSDVRKGRPGATRLTVTIDRAYLAATRSFLYAPTRAKMIEIPEGAWTDVAYS